MFAYHFPPENTVGADRPYRFYKYFPRFGQDSHVITAADVSTRPDLNAEYTPDKFLAALRGTVGWQAERLIRKVLVPGGTGITWAWAAYLLGRQFIRRHPGSRITAFSTYPPIGSHLAGLLLSLTEGVPWVADFRDPLADNPVYDHLSSFHKLLLRRIEALVLGKADLVIANTDSAKARLTRLYPKAAARTQVIWNGFDPEQRLKPAPCPDRPPCVISHVGSLYSDRAVTALLESIQRLMDTGKLDPGAIRIRLVGPAKDDCIPLPDFLAKAKQQGWLEVINKQLPQREAHEIMRHSHGLMLVLPKSTLQVSAKLFEYLQLGRPILAFVPQNSPVERILATSGVPYTCVYSDSLRESFDASVLSYFAGGFLATEPSESFETNFNGEKQAEKLANLIRALHVQVTRNDQASIGNIAKSRDVAS